MEIAMKVKTFEFHARTEKEAYIKGCKQLAKYMASKKYQNLQFKIVRSQDEPNTFQFILFTALDLGTDQREFCKICKDFHCSFYINEHYNCDRCNLKSFLNREEVKLRVSKGYYKRELK
jgi:hypothetical protein